MNIRKKIFSTSNPDGSVTRLITFPDDVPVELNDDLKPTAAGGVRAVCFGFGETPFKSCVDTASSPTMMSFASLEQALRYLQTGEIT